MFLSALMKNHIPKENVKKKRIVQIFIYEYVHVSKNFKNNFW